MQPAYDFLIYLGKFSLVMCAIVLALGCIKAWFADDKDFH